MQAFITVDGRIYWWGAFSFLCLILSESFENLPRRIAHKG